MAMNKMYNNYEYFLTPKIEIDQNHKKNRIFIGYILPPLVLLRVNNTNCTQMIYSQ